MITVAKTRIVSPDFVVLLESVGEILKIEKKKQDKDEEEHKPTSAFLLRILIDDVHHRYRFTATQE